MNTETETVSIAIDTKGCKTKFSQNFKDCEKKQSIVENQSTSINSDCSENIEIDFSIKAIIISIAVFSLIIGIASVVIAKNSLASINLNCISICGLIFIVTIITIIVSLKILKPLAKMKFLKSIIESKIKNRELIEIYCNTLVEL